MPPYLKAIGLSTALALSACTTPADVSKPLSAGGDHNVHATIATTTTGYTVDVRYKRYQMFPDISAIIEPCRSAALGRAYEEAKNRNREIEPIKDQDVRVSTGRDEILGFTKCRAFVEAHWKG